jgi:hypothetical protein
VAVTALFAGPMSKRRRLAETADPLSMGELRVNVVAKMSQQ